VKEIQVAPSKHHRVAIHQHQRRIPQLLILQGRGRGLVKPLAEARMQADADAYGERALIAQLLWCRAQTKPCEDEINGAECTSRILRCCHADMVRHRRIERGWLQGLLIGDGIDLPCLVQPLQQGLACGFVARVIRGMTRASARRWQEYGKESGFTDAEFVWFFAKVIPGSRANAIQPGPHGCMIQIIFEHFVASFDFDESPGKQYFTDFAYPSRDPGSRGPCPVVEQAVFSDLHGNGRTTLLPTCEGFHDGTEQRPHVNTCMLVKPLILP
jgi:hypothetical protein